MAPTGTGMQRHPLLHQRPAISRRDRTQRLHAPHASPLILASTAAEGGESLLAYAAVAAGLALVGGTFLVLPQFKDALRVREGFRVASVGAAMQFTDMFRMRQGTGSSSRGGGCSEQTAMQ